MTAEKNRAVKYGIYGIELLLLFILQNVPGLIPPIFGVRPQLILAASLTIAILEPEVPALFFGLAGGLLLDLSFGSDIGLYAMILTILCCLLSVGVKKKHITIGSAVWMGALFLLFAVGLDWLFRYALAGYSAPVTVLVDQFVPRYVYTLLSVPLMYLLNLGIYMGMRPAEETK